MADDTDPRFLIHQTTQMYLGEPIHFQAVQMNKSVFVWAGKQQANMKDLSIAMPAFGSQTNPAVTTVLGQDISEQSRNIGRRLASKYGMQFFVSLDIGSQDEMLIAFTEKKLSEFIKGLLT
ncbi:hypothetical protein RO3G_04605 [Lichtheimia corymbifera JMRC:FSU:9682]|uniref:Proteasome assembly chaperone 4 n=1 Tax=Lichtheimia corymbifera JMRC:FSU:9682 TaxID=1263082 RepID=A0A068RQE3_9FUNG|nr:hypothetical protein RO3G_04605 [Lichtheimia corymbifera JMRC:FSU:9682]